ncbi:MAG TPA: hypothetical protein DEA99_04485, partial [Candidatus Omnitrophica bacterium]|nr:hypothetical protein [Candidatus Omnitrophota bacterium]
MLGYGRNVVLGMIIAAFLAYSLWQTAPPEARYHFDLGISALRQARHEDAISLFQQALTHSKNPRQIILIHNGLAAAYEKLGRAHEALTHLKTAFEIDPDYHLTFFICAEMLYKHRNTGDAVLMYCAGLLRVDEPELFVHRLMDVPEDIIEEVILRLVEFWNQDFRERIKKGKPVVAPASRQNALGETLFREGFRKKAITDTPKIASSAIEPTGTNFLSHPLTHIFFILIIAIGARVFREWFGKYHKKEKVVLPAELSDADRTFIDDIENSGIFAGLIKDNHREADSVFRGIAEEALRFIHDNPKTRGQVKVRMDNARNAKDLNGVLRRLLEDIPYARLSASLRKKMQPLWRDSFREEKIREILAATRIKGIEEFVRQLKDRYTLLFIDKQVLRSSKDVQNIISDSISVTE